MMRKGISFLLLVFLMAIVIVGCGNEPTSQSDNTEGSSETPSENGTTADNDQTWTLTFASSGGPNDPYTRDTIYPWMEKVTELTNGRVDFDFYPSGQLGSLVDHYQIVRDGIADIASYAAVYIPNDMPISSSVLPLPGLSQSGYDGTMAYKDIVHQSPLLETDFTNSGVYPVYVQVTETFDFYTKGDEIRVPEDLKGKQVQGLGGVLTELISFIGATPISVTQNEMFEAFDRGIIEVAHIYPSTADTYGITDLVKYATVGARAGTGPVGFVINLDLWNEFPEDIREAILQASDEVAEGGSKGNYEDSLRTLGEWEEQGKAIHTLTAEEQAEWDKVYEEFREHYLSDVSDDHRKVLEMFQEALKNYQ
ncbi:TRAP transporter substrate-binding protein DctP [Alkalihalobacterium alkalinitrilicum]|uniref:TRAP transporter substrate-binding protein DctP n=1 Tax=Alkalihalobacterium alkalinitrilicum TaxID=427920 RepID=UPI000995C83C|nr:TRAP transporter substrate-binding protein DctP [Alkalihalobacterium alkalinitrilicum]